MSKNEIFVLHIGDGPVKVEAKKRYNAPRPSKRVYFTMGHARTAIHHLPKDIDRKEVEIVRYVPESEAERYRRALERICGATMSMCGRSEDFPKMLRQIAADALWPQEEVAAHRNSDE